VITFRCGIVTCKDCRRRVSGYSERNRDGTKNGAHVTRIDISLRARTGVVIVLLGAARADMPERIVVSMVCDDRRFRFFADDADRENSCAKSDRVVREYPQLILEPQTSPTSETGIVAITGIILEALPVLENRTRRPARFWGREEWSMKSRDDGPSRTICGCEEIWIIDEVCGGRRAVELLRGEEVVFHSLPGEDFDIGGSSNANGEFASGLPLRW